MAGRVTYHAIRSRDGKTGVSAGGDLLLKRFGVTGLVKPSLGASSGAVAVSNQIPYPGSGHFLANPGSVPDMDVSICI